ncbi:MAG: DUF456 domain-containing protein [Acidobacteriota bacterium]|nr:DUF456 domain-containing protein [Acidobacteriota bacterium]
MSILLWTLALLLVAVGVAGTILPVLPGPVLVLAGLVLAAWMDGFSHVGASTVVVLTGLTLLAYVADFIAGALGAKRSGASVRAAVGAGLGALVGLFFGIVGVLVGPFLGAVLGEVSLHGNLERAGRAGIGTWLGMVVGTAVKVSLVFMMIAVFLLAYFI